MKTCPKCESDNLTVILTPNTHHYAKLVYEACDRWIQWLPNPQKTLYIDKRNRQIQELLDTDRLSDIERNFLNQILNLRNLSPRQQNWLDKLMVML